MNFFVLGDWGGSSNIPVTKIQSSVANLMARMGNQLNTKFQIGVGDNFYGKSNFNKVNIFSFYHLSLIKDTGVTSVNDVRFETTFENGFNDSHLINTPWFHILGILFN